MCIVQPGFRLWLGVRLRAFQSSPVLGVNRIPTIQTLLHKRELYSIHEVPGQCWSRFVDRHGSTDFNHLYTIHLSHARLPAPRHSKGRELVGEL